jgi:hypothetical protein
VPGRAEGEGSSSRARGRTSEMRALRVDGVHLCPLACGSSLAGVDIIEATGLDGREMEGSQWGGGVECFGHLDMRAQAERPSARRPDIHEGASVKTGARRDRDFPNIHSASSANAERHERLCGCSPSHRRRRTAPCRAPGCNLSPALDLDLKPLGLGPRHLSATARSLCPVLRRGTITVAWRSGARPCRRATGRGISRPTVCPWRIGPRDGDVLRGPFSAIGHRGHALTTHREPLPDAG